MRKDALDLIQLYLRAENDFLVQKYICEETGIDGEQFDKLLPLLKHLSIQIEADATLYEAFDAGYESGIDEFNDNNETEFNYTRKRMEGWMDYDLNRSDVDDENYDLKNAYLLGWQDGFDCFEENVNIDVNFSGNSHSDFDFGKWKKGLN